MEIKQKPEEIIPVFCYNINLYVMYIRERYCFFDINREEYYVER